MHDPAVLRDWDEPVPRPGVDRRGRPNRRRRSKLTGKINGGKHILNALSAHYGDPISSAGSEMTITTVCTRDDYVA